MRLSIITVNLNNASGLRRTIESVVTQTSKEFEYIIIDGGSTDGSVETIKSFTNLPNGKYNLSKEKIIVEAITQEKSSSRSLDNSLLDIPSYNINLSPINETVKELSPIVFWISETDCGIYHGMNKAIAIAKGEYCQFLNSGDYLVAPDVTARMLDKMPNSSIVYGNMIKKFRNGKIFKDKNIPEITFLTFYSSTINHSSSYIKHSLFRKYGLYDENLKIVSDWKFFLITVGLNNESVSYRDIDLTFFSMEGISSINKELDKQERKLVLKQLVPSNILADYDHYSFNISQINRINSFHITKCLFYLIERILFKIQRCQLYSKERENILGDNYNLKIS